MGVVISVVVILVVAAIVFVKVTRMLVKGSQKRRGWDRCSGCRKRLRWDKEKWEYASVCSHCGGTQNRPARKQLAKKR